MRRTNAKLDRSTREQSANEGLCRATKYDAGMVAAGGLSAPMNNNKMDNGKKFASAHNHKIVRLSTVTAQRIDAVLAEGESRCDFMRAAVKAALNHRSRPLRRRRSRPRRELAQAE
jgi:hypothetical protein